MESTILYTLYNTFKTSIHTLLMQADVGVTAFSDLPRHFLCLKGIISMDFSKGAMFLLVARGSLQRPAVRWRRCSRSCPGWRWSPLGWKSANPNELLRSLLFYRRREESKKMCHQQTKTHSSSWWAACGCRAASVCVCGSNHIHTYWLFLRAFSHLLEILVLLSRTQSHRGAGV